MPPSAHWGKRPRDADKDEPFVRFSELSPAAKAERRREERVEKKERDRNLSYFRSVQRALEDQTSGGGDAGALASIVDGFFSELLKLLRADSTFYILRNGTACRVIELALTSALLLHVKSLLYVFLGHIGELMISPVASYTLETLLASLSQGLSALAETNPEALEAELAEGGVGTHTGSGVPSSATLLRSMSEELCERAEDLIVHDVGGRALRSVVLVLGGRPIRQAPLPAHPVAFPSILGAVAEAVVAAIEEGYGREYNTSSPSESWMAAVQAPATSLVVQNLLKVSDEGSVTDRCVRQRLDRLEYKGKPLLHHMLVDQLGCHVFQSFVQVPPPAAVVEAGDAAATRGTAATASSSSAKGSEGEEDAQQQRAVPGGASSCSWSRAAELVLVDLDNLLKPGSELVAQTGYVLQDLVLYAPTTVHLEWLWRRVLEPRLLLLLDVPALTAVLVQMVKRCAFEGVLVPLSAQPSMGVVGQRADSDGAEGGATATSTAAAAAAEVSHHGAVLPADVVAMVRKESGQRVRYSPVSVALQAAVCGRICEIAKQRATKGAVQYFLVDGTLGDRGYEVARYLMHLHPSASTLLQHSLDKLQREDLVAVVRHRKGSQFLQQYIRVAALATPKAPQSSSGTGKSAAPTEEPKGPLMRLLRRLQPSLKTLLYDRYAAFMLETLYECASLGVKEALVKALVPLYQEMRTAGGLPAAAEEAQPVQQQQQQQEQHEGEGEGAGEEENYGEGGEAEVAYAAPSPAQQRFIAFKVMSRCCVEQYVHRREDWTKLAERQCHVQQLLRRMLLSE